MKTYLKALIVSAAVVFGLIGTASAVSPTSATSTSWGAGNTISSAWLNAVGALLQTLNLRVSTTTFNNIPTSTLIIKGLAPTVVTSSTDATGQAIVTISSSGGGASSTNVYGTSGVTVNQVGVNATASIDEAFQNLWTSLQTFLGGSAFNSTATFNSSTVFSTVTSTLGFLNASGQLGTSSIGTGLLLNGNVLSNVGVTSFNNATGSISGVNSVNGATGTVNAVNSLNGSTGTNNLYVGGIGLSIVNGIASETISWANTAGYITTSTNLGTANFATTSISQWNNDSGYLTSVSAGTTNATGTVDSGVYFSGTNTLASTSILYVPQNFATVGCAGNASNTTLDKCVNGLYNSVSSTASSSVPQGVTIWITNSVAAANWTNSINFNVNGLVPSLKCTAGVTLKYGGAANATSAVIFNFGNPTGHLVSDDSGCTYMGHNSLIAAAQANTATTTGIFFGGSNGAVGINFHDNNINGFGQQLSINSNAYMLAFHHLALSGGNGGNMNGSCVFVNVASNSGERNVFDDVNCTDPGNSTSTNAIYFSNGGTASNFWTNSSIDDAQVYIGSSDGQTTFNQNHFENAAYGTYGRYIPIINPSSDRSTSISLSFNVFANDTSGANSFDTIIKHGGQLTAIGNNIQNYGGGTITNFSDHSNDNGVESEMICMTQVQGGGLTNLVAGAGNITYSLATGNGCVFDNANSYPIEMLPNQNNTNNIQSGNTTVATFDHSGNWTFLNNAAVGNTLSVGTTTVPSYNAQINGNAANNGVTGLMTQDSAFPTSSLVLIGSIKANDGSYVEPQIWMGPYATAASSSFTNYIFNLDDNSNGGTVLNGPGTNNISFRINNVAAMKINGITKKVGIGTDSAASTTLQVVDPTNNSSTIRIGDGASRFGCIEMMDSVNSSTLEYIYTVSGVLTATTTKPNFCQ